MKNDLDSNSRRIGKDRNDWSSGFTLIECLFTLLMLSGFLLLATATIQHHKQIEPLLMRRNRQEFEIFLIQLENELAERTLQKTENQRITLKGTNVTTFIKYQNQKIVKEENGGHHPLLMDVKTVLFQQKDSCIEITVWFNNGDINYGKWIINET